MNKLSAVLLERLILWKASGDRSVDIEFQRDSDDVRVWIYDYKLMAGIVVADENATDDWSSIMLLNKREPLRSDLALIERSIS